MILRKTILSLFLIGATTLAAATDKTLSNVATQRNHISFGYEFTELSLGDNSNHGHGFVIDYTHNFPVSKSVPLYIDFGARLGYSRISTEPFQPSGSTYPFVTDHYFHYTLHTPVSLSYRIPVKQTTLMPYLGLHTGTAIKHVPNEHDGKAYFAMLAGWQTGIGVQYRRLYASLDFTMNFGATFFSSGTATLSRLSLTLGYTF